VSIRNFIVKRKLKNVSRKLQFNNLSSAKTVGLIFSIKNKSDFDNAKEYAKELESLDKKVTLLAYVLKPEEIGNPYFGQDKYIFYSDKHFTKFGKIKETCISDFANTEFDILINLSEKNYFYLEYIFALSKAHFKISGIADCKYADFTLSCNFTKGFKNFTSQLNHYLNTIKKA